MEGVPRLGFIRRAPAAAAAAALRREITRGPLKRAVRARYDSNVSSSLCACGSNTLHIRASVRVSKERGSRVGRGREEGTDSAERGR